MFDNLKVLKPLPLTEELSKLNINWGEEIFQTKDLENLLDLYEITENGKLMYLRQEREWEKDESSPIGGYLDVKSEKWEEVNYHGIIRFYTSYCDDSSLDNCLINNQDSMSWSDIFKTEGYDWWIEFLAIFDNGITREIRLEKVEKSPISSRLASNKEWALRRELEEKKLFNQIVKKLRKVPGYRTFTRKLSWLEQKCHEKTSWAIRKIS